MNRLALCFKKLVENFPWLNKIDTLLLGLWKVFHYSALNLYIFSQLQEACGMKVLQLLKAAVTCRLLHGATCRSCREHYEQIIKTLDDILVKNSNAKWIGYRSSLLKPTTFFQMTFIEDVLSVTNGLYLLLQSNKKDFRAISRTVNSTIMIPEEIKEDLHSIYLKSFKQSEDIIERIWLIEVRRAVAGGTR